MIKTILLTLATLSVILMLAEASSSFNCTNTTHIEPSQSPVCDLCEVVVDAVAFDVKVFNSSIALLEDITEELCCLIGGPVIYNECKPIIDDIKIIVDMIISGESPDKICSYLNFC